MLFGKAAMWLSDALSKERLLFDFKTNLNKKNVFLLYEVLEKLPAMLLREYCLFMQSRIWGAECVLSVYL